MRCSNLTADEVRSALDYDPSSGVFTRRGSGWVAGGLRPDGYRIISVLGERRLAHRLAWVYAYGAWPAMHLDHINGRRSDNRIANLRLATNRENMQNLHLAHRDSTSQRLGVSWDSGRSRWLAQISDGTRNIFLGRFVEEVEAEAAYLQAKARLHPFARPREGSLDEEF